MASFQAKIGWKRPRKRKNKNYRSVRSYTTHNRKLQKNCKKIQKVKKPPLWLLLKPKQVGKRREREKIKIVVSFCSVPTRPVIKNSKKIAKKFKNTIIASFQVKIDWKMPRKRDSLKLSHNVIFFQFFWNFLLRVQQERNGTIIFIFSLSRPFPTYFGLK